MDIVHGVSITLAELVDLRHRVSEVKLFSAAGRRSPLIGLHHSRLRGRGIDFDQVRAYQPGDDVRAIDWRVTARTREPHTKLFHEERERPVYLLLEQSQQLFFGSQRVFKSVLVAQAAALIGWSVLGHSDRIGGMIFGDDHFRDIRPRRSKQNLLRLFDQLIQANHILQTAAKPPLPRDALCLMLRRAREVLRPGSLALVLCDERSLTDAAEQQLSLAARHSDLVLLPVSDPLDHRLPEAGFLRFAQGQAELDIDTRDPALQQAYQQQAQQRQARWTQLSRRLGIPLLPLSTAYDLVDQLRLHLHQHQPGYQK
ncbi:uncharacterized protein DUF58 [Pseudomonas duriflava]|uniref:Uncharacterized protein DUF58 n=1 Tax=Pseudomonas duriflava TaxID=459528 RepID=A0A562QCH9_9PSED|nr:DUF58 domain-containing protein [Pseudomonas duriflava]TWI53870.1 uncharacterized protein DUF58 [Pseudomonas duriflava]